MEPATVLSTIEKLPTLTMPKRHPVTLDDINPRHLHKVLLTTYANLPADFEALISLPGVGPATLRSLALISELIHGTTASTRDPARFSFAHGGKDGTPFPVDRTTYDRTIAILHAAIGRARIDYTEKNGAIRRLASFRETA